MRIRKERKRAKRERDSNIFGVVRKYIIGEEIGKKRGVGEEDPRSQKVPESYFISINRLIRKYFLSFPEKRCAKIPCEEDKILIFDEMPRWRSI